jgi:hypothetical protein
MHMLMTGQSPSGGYFLFDFVPAEPTAPTTALALFRGGRVPGVVREKVTADRVRIRIDGAFDRVVD